MHISSVHISIWAAECNGVIRHIIGTITWPPATGAVGVNVLVTNVSYLVPISEFTLTLPISCPKLSAMLMVLWYVETTILHTLSIVNNAIIFIYSSGITNFIHVPSLLKVLLCYKCFPDDAQCCDWHVWSFITLIIVLQSLNNSPWSLMVQCWAWHCRARARLHRHCNPRNGLILG